MSKKIKLLGMTAMLSMMFVSCSNDELKEAYQGEEILFTTKVGASRASVITNANDLESFYVYARHANDNMFIDHEKATRVDVNDAGTGHYKLENSCFWPEGANTVQFWAYGPASIDKPTVGGDEVLRFDHFEPKKDVTQQEDLVLAYTPAKEVDGTAVSLNFNHALSQIEINAKCSSTNKHVKIKGAWIVNLHGSGALAFDKEETSHEEYFHTKWSNLGEAQTYYGSEFGYIQLEDKSYKGLLDSKNKRNMMLIPQDITPLSFDENGNDNGGAYILLLCRIEEHHDFAYTPGEDDNEGLVDSGVLEGKPYHHHQLFPTKEGKYDEDAYGFTCVPLTVPTDDKGTVNKWKPGKKYVYNLEFCGLGSGGGITPPDLPEGLPEGDKGDTPGKPVLNDPISFTVTVNKWSEITSGDTNLSR